MFKDIKEIKNYGQLDAIAATISKWTKDAGTMLPKEPDVIKKLIESENSITMMGYGRTGFPMGFGAITFEWPGKWMELGSVVVSPEFRGQGYGTEIVGSLIKFAGVKYPDSNLFALCNQYSLNLFLKNGGQIITDPTILPVEVFGECRTCPKFQSAKDQGSLCCDIPVLITNGNTK